MQTHPIPDIDTPEGLLRRAVKLELLLDSAAQELDDLGPMLTPGARDELDLDEVTRKIGRAAYRLEVALEDVQHEFRNGSRL